MPSRSGGQKARQQARKQADRDAAGLVLHYMREQWDAMSALLESYRGPDATELTLGLLRLVRDFVDVLGEERGVDASRAIDVCATRLHDEAGDLPAVGLAKAFIAGDQQGIGRTAGAYEGSGIDVVFGLVRLGLGVLQELAADGGRPAHGDPALPSEEQWLQAWAYWIAGDEPPDKGYTYDPDDPRPCYVCGRNAFGRDPQGRPHHVGCIPTSDDR